MKQTVVCGGRICLAVMIKISFIERSDDSPMPKLRSALATCLFIKFELIFTAKHEAVILDG